MLFFAELKDSVNLSKLSIYSANHEWQYKRPRDITVQLLDENDNILYEKYVDRTSEGWTNQKENIWKKTIDLTEDVISCNENMTGNGSDYRGSSKCCK